MALNLKRRTTLNKGDAKAAGRPDNYIDMIQSIKSQQAEQLKLFQQRTESKTAFVQDIQEFLKKKAELETEYAQKLDKVIDKFVNKTKNQAYGRSTLLGEVSNLSPTTSGSNQALNVTLNAVNNQKSFSAVDVWTALLENSRKLCKSRVNLATRLSTELLEFASEIERETYSMSRHCHDYSVKLQNELNETINLLDETMRSYQGLSTKASSAKSKLEDSKKKAESGSNPKILGLLGGKSNEKELQKREDTAAMQMRRSYNAFNDYFVNLEAANVHKNHYFEKDTESLLEVLDRHYHESLQHVFHEFVLFEKESCSETVNVMDTVKNCADLIDGASERKQFIANYTDAFRNYTPFHLIISPEEPLEALVVNDITSDNLRSKKEKTEFRINQLTTQIEESKKRLDEITVSDNEKRLIMLNSHLNSNGLSESKNSVVFGSTSPSPSASASSNSQSPQLLSPVSKKPARKSFDLSSGANYIEAHMTHAICVAHLAKTVAQMNIMEAIPAGIADLKRRATLNRSVSKRGDPTSFGVELVQHLKAVERKLPLVVESCLASVEDLALTTEGVFRLSGSATVIREMKASFDKGLDPLINEQYALKNIHAVTGTLKQYFRELPIPLFTFDLYSAFMDSIREHRDKRTRSLIIRDNLKKLPEEYYRVLEYLLEILTKIADQGDVNKMKAHNLAIVFGPTLFRPKADNMAAMISDTGFQCQIVSMLILDFAWFFGDEDEYPAENGENDEATPQIDEDVLKSELAELDEANGTNDSEASPEVPERLDTAVQVVVNHHDEDEDLKAINVDDGNLNAGRKKSSHERSTSPVPQRAPPPAPAAATTPSFVSIPRSTSPSQSAASEVAAPPEASQSPSQANDIPPPPPADEDIPPPPALSEFALPPPPPPQEESNFAVSQGNVVLPPPPGSSDE